MSEVQLLRGYYRRRMIIYCAGYNSKDREKHSDLNFELRGQEQ
jgi:hypothetical protein